MGDVNQAEVLLHNAHVITMDAAFRQFESGAVVIRGSTIVDVGEEAELAARHPKAERFDCGGRVLMPGLVNTHTHVPMTLLRGLSDDLKLDVWLMGYIMPVEREFVSPEFVKLGTSLACAELIRSGVTSFCDMYYFEDSIAEATAEAGLRAVLGESVLKFPTPDAKSFEESLALARRFIESWKGHPLVVPAVAPHAPYTCTDEILSACSSLAQEFDVPLVIHAAETTFEVENLRKASGMPVIPYLKKQGIFDAKVIAAHCVHIDKGEMRTMRHAGAGAAHNPTSNLKLASGVAPVVGMLEEGMNVGIGTDGPASNNDLDMFEEMRLAALLAKGISGDPTAIPARTALLMATRMGANAIHIGDITGSLEAGKRADLILLDLKPVHNRPRFARDESTIYSQIVYAAKSTDVTDVMVNGKWLMRERRLETLDENDLIARAQVLAEKIDAFFVSREESVLTKLVAIGGAAEEESFEVQIKVPVANPAPVIATLDGGGMDVIRKRHYREFDTYLMFADPAQGHLRYREDEFVDDDGQVSQARYRLTLVGPAREGDLGSGVVLRRARFYAPAQHSLRFYREYFRPAREVEIEKDRLRWLVRFEEVEFYVNVDTLVQPRKASFVEVKSRTWSRRDAERKAGLATRLLEALGVAGNGTIAQDYLDLVQGV